jgi:hypothetical protein
VRINWATRMANKQLNDSWDGFCYFLAVARTGTLFAAAKRLINIVASNGFFEKKKPEYAKSGNYLTRSIVALNPVEEFIYHAHQ